MYKQELSHHGVHIVFISNPTSHILTNVKERSNLFGGTPILNKQGSTLSFAPPCCLVKVLASQADAGLVWCLSPDVIMRFCRGKWLDMLRPLQQLMRIQYRGMCDVAEHLPTILTGGW